MADEPTPSEALVTTAPQQLARPADLLLSDDEMRRMYRLAESLYLSGMWKDIKKAEGAMAKMVIGRDLGLTPAQSMQGIHIVDGGIQMHYATLGQFIRAREGYDYRAGWIKEVPRIMLRDAESGEVRPSDVPAEQVFVWHDDEDPLDGRPVVGAAIVFTVDGAQRGVSRYTVEDAATAGLIKDEKKAAWNASRRNMLMARAMSNGVKWFVPEVMGGMPVYVEGELGSAAKPSLTAGTRDVADEGSGIELGPKVEKVIERAVEVGHRGLANRAAVELAVGNRAPSVVKDWVERAHAAMDQLVAKREAEAAAGETVVDAEVVDDEVAAPEVAPEGAPDPADVPAGPTNAVSPDPSQVAGTTVDEAELALLRTRLDRLNAIDPAGLSEGDAIELQAEVEHVEQKLNEMTEGQS